MEDQGLVTRDPVDGVLDISRLDINPGNSGGPIWRWNNGSPSVAGLVSTSTTAVAVSAWDAWIQQWV